jgi:hypothetical protein
LAGWAASSAATTLTINGKPITLEGDLSATITHTASGLDLNIPGVTIDLDCTMQGAVTDECVITIGAGSSSDSGGISSGSGGVSSGSSDNSTDDSGTTDSTDDSGATDSGSGGISSGSGGISSGSGGVSSGSGDNATGGGSTDSGAGDVSSGSGENSTDDSNSTDSGKSIGSGSSGVTGGSNDCSSSGTTVSFGDAQCDWGSDAPADSDNSGTSDEDDQAGSDDSESTSGTIGGSRDSGTGSTISSGGSSSIGSGGRTVTSDDGLGEGTASDKPFPSYDGGTCGGPRVYCSGIEVGPDANQTAEVQIYKGMVTVTDITLAAGSVEGSIQWVPNASYARGSGALRVWLSQTPDGDRLDGTERCGFVTGFENRIFVSQTGSGCRLDPNGGQYYLNFAICESNDKDYSCKAPEARASTGDYSLYVKSSL